MKDRPLGFAPDVDTTEQGVITNGDMFYPSLRGIRALPNMVQTAFPLTSAGYRDPFMWANSAGFVELLAERVVDGALIMGIANSWETVTTPHGSMSGYAPFGDVLISCSRFNPMASKESTASSPFVLIPDSPSCQIIFSVKGAVFGANGALPSAPGAPAGPEYWFASDEHNYQTWLPAANNTASWGPLFFPSGPITAGAALGSQAVLYKANATYVGDFDPVDKWLFDDRSTTIGCVRQQALVVALDRHWFRGADDFYMFDGTKPVPIGGEIKEWFNRNSIFGTLNSITGSYDPDRNCIVWNFYSKIFGVNQRVGVAYHIDTGRWGRADHNVEYVRVDSSASRALGISNPFGVASTEASLIQAHQAE